MGSRKIRGTGQKSDQMVYHFWHHLWSSFWQWELVPDPETEHGRNCACQCFRPTAAELLWGPPRETEWKSEEFWKWIPPQPDETRKSNEDFIMIQNPLLAVNPVALCFCNCTCKPKKTEIYVNNSLHSCRELVALQSENQGFYKWRMWHKKRRGPDARSALSASSETHYTCLASPLRNNTENNAH